MSWSITRFFESAETRDVLDGITHLYRVLTLRRRYGNEADLWMQFCARAMPEESVPYRTDGKGGVHYLVDTAFHETADSVVSSLSEGRFSVAGACMNKAVRFMTAATPQGKEAIRAAFEGLETAFKIVTSTNKNLGAKAIDTDLKLIVDRKYERADAVAQSAAAQSLESFKDWTNACHKYRHGQDTPEPIEPPLELAILLVSNAFGFARWLSTL